ncbi:unnamed protein product, partial [Candidula unifasciata]
NSIFHGTSHEMDKSIEKRRVSITASPCCEYLWTYRQLNESRDLNNNLVRIAQNVHPQSFQMVYCLDKGNASRCRAMDHT